ncbi:MAG: CDP-glycerol glycerophosphotransferase family protein [Clostridia bacterium]
MKKILKKIYNKLATKIYKFTTLKVMYPFYYNLIKLKDINPKSVVFCEVRSLKLTDSFFLLVNKYKQEGFDVKIHFLGETNVGVVPYTKRSLAFLKDMATAKYVFLSDACNVTSCINKRSETILTQLWHACGAFKKFGYSTAELKFGVSLKQMEKYPYYKNINYITVSSPEIAWAYQEAMHSKVYKSETIATGVSRTDVFFDDNFIKNAQKELSYAIPLSKNKKIILYAPTFRGAVRSAKSPDELDIPMLYENFGDEYMILIKRHPFVKKAHVIEDKYRHFAIDVSSLLSIENLICVSDICISDYSSLVFEYSIFERPMIFFAPDIDDYNDWRGFYYSYEELTPGPVLTKTCEIVEFIKNIEQSFDQSKVKQFKEKFMQSCDGNSTQRIFDFLNTKG